MTRLTVTAKGQVTLRREILEHLGVRPGDRITVEKLPGGRITVAAERPAGRIEDLFDLLKSPERPALSLEQIEAIAAEGWAGRR